MRLTDILHPQCIKVPLTATDKQAAIYELVDLLAQQHAIANVDELKKVVWERETTRTTGIGNGIAIPHGKTSSNDQLLMAVGKPASPMEFDSLDQKPVNLILLLVSPTDQTSLHIQALAAVSQMLVNDETRENISQATDAQTVFDLIEKNQAETVKS